MRQRILALIAVVTGLALTGCGPIIKKTLVDNPDILAEAIKAHPKEIFDALREANQLAQVAAQKDAEQDETKRMDEEFKNPKAPKIDEKRILFGNKTAPITIVEYSDFQCPYCSRGYDTVRQVEKEYGDKVRVIYKHLPLDIHPMAEPAARYFEAIALQDIKKAQSFHNTIFENQRKLGEQKEAFLKETAKKVGANLEKVLKDIKSDAVSNTIKGDMAEATEFKFSGTPGFLINGVSLRGAYPFPEFKKVIDRHLSEKK